MKRWGNHVLDLFKNGFMLVSAKLPITDHINRKIVRCGINVHETTVHKKRKIQKSHTEKV